MILIFNLLSGIFFNMYLTESIFLYKFFYSNAKITFIFEMTSLNIGGKIDDLTCLFFKIQNHTHNLNNGNSHICNHNDGFW